MSQLLRANFSRLWKSGIFRLCVLFSIGLSGFMVIMRYVDIQKHSEEYAELGIEYSSADGLMFVGALYLLFAAAVLVGIFVGTEYADGTIRNKLVVGHNRPTIYLSNLIVCAVANEIVLLSHIAADGRNANKRNITIYFAGNPFFFGFDGCVCAVCHVDTK